MRHILVAAMVAIVGSGGSSAPSHARAGASHGSSRTTHHGSGSSGTGRGHTTHAGSGSSPPPPPTSTTTGTTSGPSGAGPAVPGIGNGHVTQAAPGNAGNQTAIAGGPVAQFTVSSPVAPGAPVTYTNDSFDTTPGATIVGVSWSGRQASFAAPGVYTVTLTVTDSTGRQATATNQVLVAGAVAQPPAGEPQAYFLVTSPVQAGTPVDYTDESYDLDPGATLVNETWTGRAPSFPAAGTYAVSLRVEDSTGVWSTTFTRDVVVTPARGSGSGGASPPPASQGSSAGPPPASPAWTAQAAPDPATPGQVVTITASVSAPGQAPPTLVVPAIFRETWNGIGYATRNAGGAMVADGAQTFTATVRVPDDPTFPPATYGFQVEPPGGQPITVLLIVQAASAYVEPIVAGA